jgi:hypothetical protein
VSPSKRGRLSHHYHFSLANKLKFTLLKNSISYTLNKQVNIFLIYGVANKLKFTLLKNSVSYTLNKQVNIFLIYGEKLLPQRKTSSYLLKTTNTVISFKIFVRFFQKSILSLSVGGLSGFDASL